MECLEGESPSFVFVEREEEKGENGAKNSASRLWNAYRNFVRKNHISLELLEAGLSRILFWAPSTSSGTAEGEDDSAEQRHRQREILYGILSLHRLAMDVAMENDEDAARHHLDFGMSVRPNICSNPHQQHKTLYGVSPASIRITITVIQSLLPSLLEMSQSSSLSKNENYRRNGRIRLYVERLKFFLRLILMGTYWRQLYVQYHEKQKYLQEDVTPPVSVGVMKEGGLYYGGTHHVDDVPTAAQEDALWRRQNYSGRRTGRLVLRRSPNDRCKEQVSTNRDSIPNISASNWNALLVMLGELLYAYRPLYWASAEANVSPSYRKWIISFTMDLVSLQLCRFNHSTSMNNATQEELKRRKMRLMLHLLRAPIWNKITEPASDQIESALERIPVLGRLTSTYLRDWLWYMKHPYVAEQG